MKIIKTSEALPKSGRYVLAWLEGAKIPMRAMWADQHTMPLGDDADPEWGEYSEEKDEYFCPAGWYEMNQFEEQHWGVSGNVVAWCELPRLDHQCLAQIEEPAQPIAGYRISDPSDPELGFWFSETPCAEGYTSEPLYAGAAPAAVAPGITEWYTLAEIKAKIATHDYNAELLLQHAMLLLESAAVAPQGAVAWMTPEGDRVVTEATMAGARKDGGASLSSLRPYAVALVRAGEPAASAPALEAPAAPQQGFQPGNPGAEVEVAWLLVRSLVGDGEGATDEADTVVLALRCDGEDWDVAADWKAESTTESVHANGGWIVGWMPYEVPAARLAAAPQAPRLGDDALYLLRRLLSNQHTLTGPEFRAELEKIVGAEFARLAAVPQAPAAPCGLCGANEAFTGTCGGGRQDPRALCFGEAAPAAPAVDADPLGLRDVGEALVKTIERNADALKAAGWTAPMDCPSEIVVDLLNLLDEAKAAPAVDAALNALIDDIRALPTMRASEIDGEESDGTPKHWRNRPFVSLRKLEVLLRDRVTASNDTALLDAMERHRIAVVPEHEGPWDAELYEEGEEPQHIGSGATPREALRAAIAAQAKEGGAA